MRHTDLLIPVYRIGDLAYRTRFNIKEPLIILEDSVNLNDGSGLVRVKIYLITEERILNFYVLETELTIAYKNR